MDINISRRLGVSNRRFLTSPKLRNALYDAAGGKCQICGTELLDGWHADHIRPWVKTRRTNIFEMQALCGPCNLRKGTVTPMELHFNWEILRIGQIGAIRVIELRAKAGERFTAIVLPTRYGKSDVMRISAMLLWYAGTTGPALVLSPGEYLRNQFADQADWQECFDRYSIVAPDWKGRVMEHAKKPFTPNGEKYLSATMQLLHANIDVFVDWVKNVIHETGKPPIVYVDETEMESEKNTWGGDVNKLADAGAIIVLLTATPYRADGESIPGFDCEIVSREEFTVKLPNPQKDAPEGFIYVNTYEGIKQCVKLKPHWETTFREAWDEEDPPVLCKISRIPFDVELTEIKDSLQGVETKPGLHLSELSPHQVRANLTEICRHPIVIRKGVEILIDILEQYKLNGEAFTGIVYCGNDDMSKQSELSVNAHANDIERTIKGIDPHQHVIIATTASGEDASELIKRFSDKNKPYGTILIVKQMASRGLNAPRLKVCLDLSSVRTPNSNIQRMMRTCTVFKKTSHAVYIPPADIIGAALFEQLVTSQNGGETTTTELALIKEELKPKKEKSDKVRYVIDGAQDADVEDSNQNLAVAASLPAAHAMINAFPALMEIYTLPEITQRSTDFGVAVIPKPERIHVIDISEQIKNLRDRCSERGEEVIRLRFRKMGREYTHEEWKALSQSVWEKHKGVAGIPLIRGRYPRLEHITDMAQLQRLLESLEGELYGQTE
jgi:hypothetical protein